MKDCLFCQIAGHRLPADIVAETELSLAFRDINPQAPCHILVIPKKHVATLDEAVPEDQEMLGHLLLVAQGIAREQNLASAYRIVINNGASAGQTVFHIHIHLLAGRHLGWPPG